MSITARRILRLFFEPQPVVERAMLASERSSPPNQIGRLPDQVADHDAIAVALADRDLVDADDLGPGPARAAAR